MTLYPHIARAALLLVLVALVTAAGCQKEPGFDRKGEASATATQVTVDVTGMT